MLSIFDPDKIGSSKLIEMYMDEVKKLLGDLGEDIKKRGGGFFKGGDKVVQQTLAAFRTSIWK